MNCRLGSALLLTALLVGCGAGEPPKPDAFVLTTALPAPATPGQTVTLYGRLPAGESSVTLDGLQGDPITVQAVPVKEGLQFVLPPTLLADLYEVTLQGVSGQKVLLDVVPKIERVTLTGSTLVIEGAGWGTDPSRAGIEVNRQYLPVTGTATSLQTIVNASQDISGTASDLYGVFNVRVLVGERASETRTVRKEAARLEGRVYRPLENQASATASGFSAQALRPAVINPATTTLLVPAGATLPPQELAGIRPLPLLNSQQARYTSVRGAQRALDLLLQQGVAAEFDQRMQVQDTQKTELPLHLGTQAVTDRQWFWPLLGLQEAWKTTEGKGITVAVIDTGVASNHPDLRSTLLPGRDYVDGDLTPQDVSGHGTHVAGLIGAHGQVKGAAPQVALLPVRVIGPDGGSVSDLIQGLLWAAGLDPEHPNPHPAQVINLSLGTPEYSERLAEAVQQVLKAGVIVVAATGNDGGLPYSPANLPGVIAVTSVNGPVTTYQPTYANRGPGTRIAAYGGDLNADQNQDGERDGILSTDITSAGAPGYALRNGTSMAAPQVSGIAALLLAQGTPAHQVKALLEGQATDLGVSGMDLTTGWGLVNARPLQGEVGMIAAALDEKGRVITYVRPEQGQFTLNSLPPNTSITVIAGMDREGNGVIGEAGELFGTVKTTTSTAGQISKAAITLQPTDGRSAVALNK
ncbi:S8 family peptidase [Deinococcus gobiensis]|nr:S8 family serine peptidase [Deinococcus gobiensis]